MLKYLVAPLAALGTYALVRTYAPGFGATAYWILSGSGWAAIFVLGAVLYFWGRE